MIKPDYDEVPNQTVRNRRKAGAPDCMSGNTTRDGRDYGFLIEPSPDDGITDVSIYDLPIDEVPDIGSPSREIAITTHAEADGA